MERVDISGAGQSAVLAILYNHARVGPHASPHAPTYFIPADAREYLEQVQPGSDGERRIDYINSREIKVTFYPDETVDPTFYDVAHGEGTVAKLVRQVRTTGNVFRQ